MASLQNNNVVVNNSESDNSESDICESSESDESDETEVDSVELMLHTLLGTIYADHVSNNVVNVDHGMSDVDLDEFKAHYTKLITERKHPTHTYVEMNYSFSWTPDFSEEGVIETAFFEWLNKYKPTLHVSTGKHTDARMPWNGELDYSCCDVTSDNNFFAVEGHKHLGVPDYLDSIHSNWKEIVDGASVDRINEIGYEHDLFDNSGDAFWTDYNVPTGE